MTKNEGNLHQGEDNGQGRTGTIATPSEFTAEALENAVGGECLICTDPREYAFVEEMRMKVTALFRRGDGTPVTFTLPPTVAWSHKQVEQLLAVALFGVSYDLHPRAMDMTLVGAGKLVKNFPAKLQQTIKEEFLGVVTLDYNASVPAFFMATIKQLNSLA